MPWIVPGEGGSEEPVGAPRGKLRPNQPIRPGGKRYWQFAYHGGGEQEVAGLPIVATIDVNGITATTAHIVGTVNPNGSNTSWWITYGTTIPLPGTNTASASAGSGNVPLTETFTLTGLTTGVTYYVAMVGQSSAGLVLGNTIAFVPAGPIVTSSAPIVPYGQPSVTIPHFNVPFQLHNNGAIVVEQDTLEEVLASVNVVVDCEEGQCPQLPNFGRPSLTFAQEPVNTSELVAAIQRWEPRAIETVAADLSPDEQQNWMITLLTSSTGAQGI